jgi:hypothetical protein
MTLNGFLSLLFIFGDSRILTLDSAFFDYGSSVDCELLPLVFILSDSRVLTLDNSIVIDRRSGNSHDDQLRGISSVKRHTLHWGKHDDITDAISKWNFKDSSKVGITTFM